MSIHPQPVPFGEWPSLVTSDWVVTDTVRLGQIRTDGDACYWLEGRPDERGRGVIVRWSSASGRVDVTPPGWNVRTRAQEYGGGDFAVSDGAVVFSRNEDQRLYLQREAGEEPLALTPDMDARYADAVFDPGRRRVICVMEDRRVAPEPENLLVAIDLLQPGAPKPLLQGHDFFSNPRLNADATRLAWLCWDHPRLPWDGTELWVGEVGPHGDLRHLRRIAGGEDESVFQPEWGPDGKLYFVSDRSGWWNLYRWDGDAVQAVCEDSVEMGLPQWVFGMATYAFPAPGKVAIAQQSAGVWRLVLVDLASGAVQRLAVPYSEIGAVHALPGSVVVAGGGPAEAMSIARYELESRRTQVLRKSSALHLDADAVALPQAIEFPTRDGETAHAFFYRPTHPECVGPPDTKPPLIVKCHGGPTAAAGTALDPRFQFWTSRGFAILDVNYRGSTGFGRAYRRKLDGQWGVLDVTDCIDGSQYLVEQAQVDEKRLLISGSSAGGFTVLSALSFHRHFVAGASYYGIGDLEALLRDTHKFEARYFDQLIGPYPARRDLYIERSPVNALDRLACPVIFFQGEDDRVVPPNQTEQMVAALAAKGVPVACRRFAGEGHGFRQADNIRAAIEGELQFYAAMLGLNLPEPLDDLEIINRPR